VSEPTTSREELELAIETRKELGVEREAEVVAAFLERIDQRLGERADESARALKEKRNHQKEMILGSMGIAIPLLAIAAIFTGLAGVIAVCVALAVIAVVVSRSD
jgi:VIT1/CCC1 family predicted Fe2+/Mn2+ transporter